MTGGINIFVMSPQALGQGFGAQPSFQQQAPALDMSQSLGLGGGFTGLQGFSPINGQQLAMQQMLQQQQQQQLMQQQLMQQQMMQAQLSMNPLASSLSLAQPQGFNPLAFSQPQPMMPPAYDNLGGGMGQLGQVLMQLMQLMLTLVQSLLGGKQPQGDTQYPKPEPEPDVDPYKPPVEPEPDVDPYQPPVDPYVPSQPEPEPDVDPYQPPVDPYVPPQPEPEPDVDPYQPPVDPYVPPQPEPEPDVDPYQPPVDPYVPPVNPYPTFDINDYETAYDRGHTGDPYGDRGPGFWGDPHFVGDDGEVYDVQGENGKIYNLLSDKGFQVNGQFRTWGAANSGATIVSDIGIKLGDNRIELNAGGSPKVNGYELKSGETKDLGDGRKVSWDGKNMNVVSDEYDLTFEVVDGGNGAGQGKYINAKMGVREGKNPFMDGVGAHGIWGQTIDGGKDIKGEGDLGKGKQGGGVLDKVGADGKLVKSEKGDTTAHKDYEVTDLFGDPRAEINRFDAEQGTGLTKKPQADVDPYPPNIHPPAPEPDVEPYGPTICPPPPPQPDVDPPYVAKPEPDYTQIDNVDNYVETEAPYVVPQGDTGRDYAQPQPDIYTRPAAY